MIKNKKGFVFCSETMSLKENAEQKQLMYKLMQMGAQWA